MKPCGYSHATRIGALVLALTVLMTGINVLLFHRWHKAKHAVPCSSTHFCHCLDEAKCANPCREPLDDGSCGDRWPPQCHWDHQTKACAACDSRDCGGCYLESMCNANEACAWDDHANHCKVGCNNQFCNGCGSQMQCESQTNCEWDPTSGAEKCRGLCKPYNCDGCLNADECTAYGTEGCQWDPEADLCLGGCGEHSCDDCETKGLCNGQDGCIWLDESKWCESEIAYQIFNGGANKFSNPV